MCTAPFIRPTDELNSYQNLNEHLIDDGRFFSEFKCEILEKVYLHGIYTLYENRRVLINKYTGNIVEGKIKHISIWTVSPFVYVQRSFEVVHFLGFDASVMKLKALEFIEEYNK